MAFKAWVSIVLGFVLVSSIFYFAYIWSVANATCDDAPYIYATYHDLVPNVVKYSRNGCLLSSTVLIGGPKHTAPNHTIEMRSLVFGKYKDSPVLYIADAFTNDSYLNIYDQCDEDGQRTFIKSAVSTQKHPGANHIYGICFDQEDNVYVSSQHTDNVMRFHKDTFKPMPYPPRLERADPQYYKNYAGTFLQFGLPNSHGIEEQGVRDIVAVGEYIWVANENSMGVYVVHAVSGQVETIVRNIKVPICLHYHPETDTVFVASKAVDGAAWQGAVYAVNAHTYAVTRHFKTLRMTHPTGMISHSNILYVAEQKLGQILSFNVHTGAFLKTIVRSMPEGIEKLALSDC